MTSALPPSPDWGTGIGLRAPHVEAVIATRPAVGFLEIHAENHMRGGPVLRRLEQLRRDYPVSVHGVGLSLGSAEGVDTGHLDRLADLVRCIDPVLVSEHLSWSVAGGVYLNDLLPLPYTTEVLGVIAGNVERVQDRLGRRILIENPSCYLRYRASSMTEPDFLAALSARTGCGVLLDVNNIAVTTANLGGEPEAWIERLAVESVSEIHLAGHSISDADGVPILIDDHGSPVRAEVWSLYRRAVARFPKALTLVEWDSNLPALDVLVGEAHRADRERARAVGRNARDAVAA